MLKVYASFTLFLYRPPGVFEMSNFANGTKAVMEKVCQATNNGYTTVVGTCVKTMNLFNVNM